MLNGLASVGTNHSTWIYMFYTVLFVPRTHWPHRHLLYPTPTFHQCLNTWAELLKTFKDPASFTVMKEVATKDKGASEGEEEGEEGEEREGEEDGLPESREQ